MLKIMDKERKKYDRISYMNILDPQSSQTSDAKCDLVSFIMDAKSENL